MRRHDASLPLCLFTPLGQRHGRTVRRPALQTHPVPPASLRSYLAPRRRRRGQRRLLESERSCRVAGTRLFASQAKGALRPDLTSWTTTRSRACRRTARRACQGALRALQSPAGIAHASATTTSGPHTFAKHRREKIALADAHECAWALAKDGSSPRRRAGGPLLRRADARLLTPRPFPTFSELCSRAATPPRRRRRGRQRVYTVPRRRVLLRRRPGRWPSLPGPACPNSRRTGPGPTVTTTPPRKAHETLQSLGRRPGAVLAALMDAHGTAHPEYGPAERPPEQHASADSVGRVGALPRSERPRRRRGRPSDATLKCTVPLMGPMLVLHHQRYLKEYLGTRYRLDERLRDHQRAASAVALGERSRQQIEGKPLQADGPARRLNATDSTMSASKGPATPPCALSR